MNPVQPQKTPVNRITAEVSIVIQSFDYGWKESEV